MQKSRPKFAKLMIPRRQTKVGSKKLPNKLWLHMKKEGLYFFRASATSKSLSISKLVPLKKMGIVKIATTLR